MVVSEKDVEFTLKHVRESAKSLRKGFRCVAERVNDHVVCSFNPWEGGMVWSPEGSLYVVTSDVFPCIDGFGWGQREGPYVFKLKEKGINTIRERREICPLGDLCPSGFLCPVNRRFYQEYVVTGFSESLKPDLDFSERVYGEEAEKILDIFEKASKFDYHRRFVKPIE